MAAPRKRGFRRATKKETRRKGVQPQALIELFRQPDIFLSYNANEKKLVRRLADDLSLVGVDAWLDEWELEVGDPLHLCIGRALEESEYVAVVLSPAMVKSPWCLDELATAFAREKRETRKVVIPLLCKRAQPPAMLEDRLYLDIGRDYLNSIVRLSALVHKLNTRKIQRAIETAAPQSVKDAAKMLEGCGWDGIRVFDEDDFFEFAEELRKDGFEINGNVFSFPKGFKKLAPKYMHLAVVRGIFGDP